MSALSELHDLSITRYAATARRWSAETMPRRADRGFRAGGGAVASPRADPADAYGPRPTA